MAKRMLDHKPAFLAAVCFLAPTALYACVDPDLTPCTTDYTNSLEGSAITDKGPFCRVLQTYYSCADKVCGTIPKDIMDFIVEAQTHYFNCGISRSPVCVSVSPFLLIMSAMFTVLCIL